MGDVANVNDLLDDHVVLDLECLDRIYLNVYVPKLQMPGQVIYFLHDHRKMPIASPAIMEKMGNRFREAVRSFATTNNIPIVRFMKGERHIEVMEPYLKAATEPGIVAIGVAQEFQSVFSATKNRQATGVPSFTFAKADRRVTAYYFYLMDADFGAGFIKICSYFPYPGKVWVNGHEWAKRQALKAGIGFTELANGFASCEDPAGLQAICNRLGPNQIEEFFQRWMQVIPIPLDDRDRLAGFWWELSMRPRTIVFDAPRRARSFFESTVADNIDIGRPDEVKLIFARQIRKNTSGEFATRIVTRGTDVAISAFYKHSRIKEYLKEGRALRIETVLNCPPILVCNVASTISPS